MKAAASQDTHFTRTATMREDFRSGRQSCPGRLIAILCGYLDLASLAALSEVNREWMQAVGEDYFEAKLVQLTQWDFGMFSWRGRAKAYLQHGPAEFQPHDWPIHTDELLPPDFYRLARPEPSSLNQRLDWFEEDVANHGYYVYRELGESTYHYVNLSCNQPDEEIAYNGPLVDEDEVISRYGINVQFSPRPHPEMDRVFACSPDLFVMHQRDADEEGSQSEVAEISIKYKNGVNSGNLDPDVTFHTCDGPAEPNPKYRTRFKDSVNIVDGEIFINTSDFFQEKRRHRKEKLKSRDGRELSDNMWVYKVHGNDLQLLESGFSYGPGVGMLYYDGTIWHAHVNDKTVQLKRTNSECDSSDSDCCWQGGKVCQDHKFPHYATVQNEFSGLSQGKSGALIDLKSRRIMHLPASDDPEPLRMVGVSQGTLGVWDFTQKFRQGILAKLDNLEADDSY